MKVEGELNPCFKFHADRRFPSKVVALPVNHSA